MEQSGNIHHPASVMQPAAEQRGSEGSTMPAVPALQAVQETPVPRQPMPSVTGEIQADTAFAPPAPGAPAQQGKPLLQPKGIYIGNGNPVSRKRCMNAPCNGLVPRSGQANGQPGAGVVQGKFITDEPAAADASTVPKETFLKELRNRITQIADEVLASVGQTSENCPYIAHWFSYYEGRDAAHIENAINRYAPAATEASDWRAVIEAVAIRVREAFSQHVRDGSLDGVPEELPDDLVEEKPPVQAKAINAVTQLCNRRPVKYTSKSAVPAPSRHSQGFNLADPDTGRIEDPSEKHKQIADVLEKGGKKRLAEVDASLQAATGEEKGGEVKAPAKELKIERQLNKVLASGEFEVRTKVSGVRASASTETNEINYSVATRIIRKRMTAPLSEKELEKRKEARKKKFEEDLNAIEQERARARETVSPTTASSVTNTDSADEKKRASETPSDLPDTDARVTDEKGIPDSPVESASGGEEKTHHTPKKSGRKAKKQIDAPEGSRGLVASFLNTYLVKDGRIVEVQAGTNVKSAIPEETAGFPVFMNEVVEMQYGLVGEMIHENKTIMDETQYKVKKLVDVPLISFPFVMVRQPTPGTDLQLAVSSLAVDNPKKKDSAQWDDGDKKRMGLVAMGSEHGSMIAPILKSYQLGSKTLSIEFNANNPKYTIDKAGNTNWG